MTKAPRLVGAGQGDEDVISDSPCTATPSIHQRQIDPRASWLLRASARYHLVRNGVMTLDEVFDDGFICDLFDAIPNACHCHTGICQSFDRALRELRQRQFRAWRAR